ncbi:hypothetical protein Varpa_2157 [Variovorax paradoxus EPS]|uniref:Uncharacterized protein n=2 Tax=Variovorax paradoxus TaxID=34073 RepID=E6UUU8_VARPE|nr:hypothetical protein Varpa_2157 [Variovorax paradoxus EPS]
MFCVIELILSGGWHEDVERNCRLWIEAWKVNNDINDLFDEISIEEMELFMHDAKVLKLF